jgi:hypothetical protein
MKIKRYYLKQSIELAEIRSILAVLMTDLKWQITENKFVLYYPGEDVEIDQVDDLTIVVDQRGKPACVFGTFRSAAFDAVEIETCGPDVTVMTVDRKTGVPDEVFGRVEPMLGLKRITEAPVSQSIKSAFIAHAFDEEGRRCASEVSHFLELLDIKNESGIGFSPQSVAGKVRERLARNDMFVAIVTPQEDTTWLIQECIAAKVSKKPVFLLKREDLEFKPGMLGDLEFIPFPSGHVSKTFVHILEGVRAIKSDATNA